jgi:cysteinyl-tRNA synthetase
LHNEFVNVPEGKMAKSEGTGITLSEIVDGGFSPLAYRYFLLMAHYRTPVIFTWEALTAAQNAYEKLIKMCERLDEGGIVDQEYKKKFVEKLENDFNTPQALAVVWTMLKDKSVPNNNKLATLLDFDKVMGLGL